FAKNTTANRRRSHLVVPEGRSCCRKDRAPRCRCLAEVPQIDSGRGPEKIGQDGRGCASPPVCDVLVEHLRRVAAIATDDEQTAAFGGRLRYQKPSERFRGGCPDLAAVLRDLGPVAHDMDRALTNLLLVDNLAASGVRNTDVRLHQTSSAES